MDQLPDSVRKIFDRAKGELQRGQGELQRKQEELGKEEARLVIDREIFEKKQKEFRRQQQDLKKRQDTFAAKERGFEIDLHQLHVDRQAVNRDRISNTFSAKQLKEGQEELERDRQTLRNDQMLHVTASLRQQNFSRIDDSLTVTEKLLNGKLNRELKSKCLC